MLRFSGDKTTIIIPTINHEVFCDLLLYDRQYHITTLHFHSNMLALMHVEERSNAAQVVNAPIDPAQALLRRFTAWEKRMDNLIEFFTQIQRFQKEHSRQYSALSYLAGQTFGDETLPEEGIVSIWRGLRDKTAELARFYDGLYHCYYETIIKDLKMRLSDIRTFTARKEPAGNRRGGEYWKAYRSHNGKLHRAYLGKSEALTLERLDEIAFALAQETEKVS